MRANLPDRHRAPRLRASHLPAYAATARSPHPYVTPQALPCTMLHDAHQLGWLAPKADWQQHAANLSADLKLELPLWLARPLLTRDHVGVELPDCYNSSMRLSLRADPSHVDLHDAEYFFDVGVDLASMLEDDLGGALLHAFTARYRGLVRPALNVTRKRDTAPHTNKLTAREKQLFLTGYQATCNYDAWRCEKKRRIEPSALVAL